MTGKRLRKIIRQLLLIFCILKNKIYVQTYISKLNSNVKKKILLMIPNEEKEWRHYLAVKSYLYY